VLLEALSTARDLGRLHEIASVLIRHGLGDAVRRLGIGSVLRRAGKRLHWRAAAEIGTKGTAQHAREALEELGPTFVKVGQLLAGRTDLLPSAWTEELGRLRERATPVPFEEIRQQLVEDLGGEPESVFAEFEPKPLAAASIAQVHRATTHGGEPVVLKIRRPGIADVVEADLRLLERLAEVAEGELPELRRYRPRQIVRQFASSLRAEIDLRTEAHNVDRLRRGAGVDDGIVVPRVYGQWSRPGLCVMEFLDGPSVDKWLHSEDRTDAEGISLARIGAEAILRMVLVDGFYHADPHAGNLLRLHDGRLGILDFGMVGRLSHSRRQEFFEILLAVMDNREDHVVDVLLDWSLEGETDIEALTQDCAQFIDRYREVPLGRLDVVAMLSDVASLLRENNLYMPSDVAMLLKVFLTLDGFGRQLDPHFVLAAHLEPMVREAARTRSSPFGAMRRGMRETRALLLALPRHSQRMLRQLRRGRMRLEIDLRSLGSFGKRLDRSANRITVGMITAALIVGTAISMTVSGGPTLLGLPMFGLIGFLSSMAAGVWLLWSILRSGKR
jgi:ubiquinone biosynthesis protein